MLRSVLLAITSLTRWERWLLTVLTLTFVGSLCVLLWRFRLFATVLVPTTGGTYIEGSVGSFEPLNPWFTVRNDVNRDIVSLVFSGLLRYNPDTEKIEEDLATMKISDGGKVYTLRLKDDIFWHDSTPDNPHPVRAEDIVFTYEMTQDPQFPNSLLHENMEGITINAVDDRTVQFRLSEPYSFFPSSLTLGILPKRAFDGVPPGKLDQVLDFGFHPIGAGPYKFKSIVQTDFSTEVTLDRFERTIPPVYRLDQVVFRIFPDFGSMLADLSNLDGIRLLPRNEKGEPIAPRHFTTRSYSLPQYVALFFNLDHPLFQNRSLRLGLQLGIDKAAIVDKIRSATPIDTPLLEMQTEDWKFQHDATAAQGALFEANWNLPEKVRLQRLLEQREANATGPLKIAPIVLLDTGAVLTLTGSVTEMPLDSRVNGIRVQPLPNSSGTWIVGLPTAGGTGAITLGTNLIRLTNPKGRILDSFYVARTTTAFELERLAEEQKVVDQFLASKASSVSDDQRITPESMFLEEGHLRLRRSVDPLSVRVNEAGRTLALTMLVSPNPPEYAVVADLIRQQWESLGVNVTLAIPTSTGEFEDLLLHRSYDIVLFGESLLDNLDSYPYWHSSGVQRITGNRSDLRLDAYNLSQYASFQADSLLEHIRTTTDTVDRKESLGKLRKVLSDDIPAIILYTPVYVFAVTEDIHGVDIGRLSLHSDRFLTLNNWYVREERTYRPGLHWTSFFPWLFGQMEEDETETLDLQK
jgi:ABC-type transport system substrate-binding protein